MSKISSTTMSETNHFQIFWSDSKNILNSRKFIRRLLLCNLRDQGSSHKNSLLKYLKVRLCILTLLRPRIGRSLVYWVRLFLESLLEISYCNIINCETIDTNKHSWRPNRSDRKNANACTNYKHELYQEKRKRSNDMYRQKRNENAHQDRQQQITTFLI